MLPTGELAWEIDELLFEHPKIEQASVDAGMRTLRVAGARRVRDGIFGPDELLRVLS